MAAWPLRALTRPLTHVLTNSHPPHPALPCCPQRNYRAFLLFVYTSTVLCMYAFGCSMAQLFVRHRELVNEARARGESGDNK